MNTFAVLMQRPNELENQTTGHRIPPVVSPRAIPSEELSAIPAPVMEAGLMMSPAQRIKVLRESAGIGSNHAETCSMQNSGSWKNTYIDQYYTIHPLEDANVDNSSYADLTAALQRRVTPAQKEKPKKAREVSKDTKPMHSAKNSKESPATPTREDTETASTSPKSPRNIKSYTDESGIEWKRLRPCYHDAPLLSFTCMA